MYVHTRGQRGTEKAKKKGESEAKKRGKSQGCIFGQDEGEIACGRRWSLTELIFTTVRKKHTSIAYI